MSAHGDHDGRDEPHFHDDAHDALAHSSHGAHIHDDPSHGGHGHSETHAHERHVSPLERGAGRGKLLFVDAFSGVAGDMTAAALLDLGVPLGAIEAALALLPVEGFHLHVGHVHRSGILATTFDVHVEAPQPERDYAGIAAMIAASKLDPGVRARALAIFRRLGEAESAVHRVPLNEVHFHEVGAVDAIVDVIAAAVGFEWLGADVAVSPLPLGRGFVSARHGVLPLPAPAAVECLRGVPTYAAEIDAELVTPTGAAIVATVGSSFVRWPAFVPERTGWGAGKSELADRPNLLRVVLGTPASAAVGFERAAAEHVVVEANIDDMTGELASHALTALLESGAVDAWAVPVVMKKGRPGLVLCALARVEAADAVVAVFLRETTSIGVRKTPVSRVERPRKIIEVATRFGPIPVKCSEGAYGSPQIKPEFDACARAAAAAGVPVREVIAEALWAARSAAGALAPGALAPGAPPETGASAPGASSG